MSLVYAPDSPAAKGRRPGLVKSALAEVQASVPPPDGLSPELHMDDCDEDNRRFWCYVTMRGYDTRRDPHPGVRPYLMRLRAALLAHLRARCGYQACWNLESSPRLTYYQVDGRRYSGGHSGCSWIYILTLYGGE